MAIISTKACFCHFIRGGFFKRSFSALYYKLNNYLFKHLVFGFCKLIDAIIPDIPEELEIKIKREKYLAKKALNSVLWKCFYDWIKDNKT